MALAFLEQQARYWIKKSGFRLEAGLVRPLMEMKDPLAGYSGTPLVKKLGIKPGFRVGVVNAPKGFPKELEGLPADVRLITGQLVKPLDLVILFASNEQVLKKEFSKLAKLLVSNGVLWVAWPKKSSGVATDLLFTNVQRVGLNAGLVDVKICAINDVWSGLKFVYRLKDRKSI